MEIKVKLNEGIFARYNIHVHKGDRLEIFVDDKLVHKDCKCVGGI